MTTIIDQDSEYLQRPDAKGHLKVLEVLRKWDPLGVISARNMAEYDSYAPVIIRMLDNRCTPKELARFLYNLKTKDMGLAGFWLMAEEKRISQELVDWWN